MLEYLKTQNPIVFALMAKMQYDERKIVRLKAEFLRRIAGASVNEAKKGILFEFVESYMLLDGDRQAEFYELIESDREFKEVEKMVTVYEKRGIKKGLEKGLKKGRILTAKSLLAAGLSVKEVASHTQLTIKEVKALA